LKDFSAKDFAFVIDIRLTMGIKKGARTYLIEKLSGNNANSCIIRKPLSAYKGKRILIDYSNISARFAHRSKNAWGLWGVILEWINFINKFYLQGIHIIIVFDGKPRDEKMPVIEHRIAIREKAYAKIKEIRDKNAGASDEKSDDSAIESINETEEDIDTIAKLTKRAHSIKTSDIVASKRLFDIMGVQYIHLEDIDADTVLKFAIDKDIADVCFSGDMDTIAYGCKRVIQDLDFLRDMVTDIDYDKMLEILEVDSDTLLTAFILSGTDYNNSLKKTTFAINLELAKKWKTIDAVIKNLHEINVGRSEDDQIGVPNRFDWETSLAIYKEQLPIETVDAIKEEFEKQGESSEFLKTKEGYNKLLEYSKKLQAIKSLNSDDKVKVFKYVRKFEEYVKVRFGHSLKIDIPSHSMSQMPMPSSMTISSYYARATVPQDHLIGKKLKPNLERGIIPLKKIKNQT
jgi:5'-3' exonuclease